MKFITLILCATLTCLLLPAKALAAGATKVATNVVREGENTGGRASNPSDSAAAPTADVCHCGSDNSLVVPTRGSTPPAGTLRAPVAAAAPVPGKSTGGARSAEAPAHKD